MDIKQKFYKQRKEIKIARATHLFRMHHNVIDQLNEVCKEQCDLNLTDFLKVYEQLEEELKGMKGKEYLKEIIRQDSLIN